MKTLLNLKRMRNIILFVVSMTLIPAVRAQLKTRVDCPSVEVNVLDGMVNGLKPNVPGERIKRLLPCFTSSANTGDSTAKCGATVFYKDKDIYFYTDRDYIEIGPKFKGKLSIPLMGAHRNKLFPLLGNPKIKDAAWDAFQTNYGILILYYDKAGKVNKMQMSTEGPNTIQLCE